MLGNRNKTGQFMSNVQIQNATNEAFNQVNQLQSQVQDLERMNASLKAELLDL